MCVCVCVFFFFVFLQSLAEIAKQKHGQSLEKALADCHITEEPNLYETRVMTDSDGRLVKETAV